MELFISRMRERRKSISCFDFFSFLFLSPALLEQQKKNKNGLTSSFLSLSPSSLSLPPLLFNPPTPHHHHQVSHRTHHSNHGHVENDESWHPVSRSLLDGMDATSRAGRLTLPWAMFAFPFYLWKRSPGKEGSHYDPKCDLFVESEAGLVKTSNAFMVGMLGVLAAAAYLLGPLNVFALYVVPYWINVVWLDVVTYLHHHGPSDENEKMPWFRGEEWSYLRGGLTTIDRDYGIFNKIHHDIGTHVVHHLFPQIPHYNLVEATEAAKPVFGEYYREPAKSPGPIPFHLVAPLIRSFRNDHFVDDEGDIVTYRQDPEIAGLSGAASK